LAYEPDSAFVSSSTYEPSSALVSSSIPILVSSSSDDDSEDENPPLPAHLPPDDSIEHEPIPAPSLPRWVRLTQEAVGDLVTDPSDQCRHVHNSNEPLLFWLKFQRLMIQRNLQKLHVIQIGIQ
jgi:hypothetical protein